MTEDFDDLGYAEVRQRFARGDFHDPSEQRAVTKWLRAQEKEQEFMAACNRASISSALEATRSARAANRIAFLALLVSAVSAQEQIGSLLKAVRGHLGF